MILKICASSTKENPSFNSLKNDKDTPVGFMGIVDHHLEMLLLHLVKEVKALARNSSNMESLNTPLTILL